MKTNLLNCFLLIFSQILIEQNWEWKYFGQYSLEEYDSYGGSDLLEVNEDSLFTLSKEYISNIGGIRFFENGGEFWTNINGLYFSFSFYKSSTS